MSRRPGQPTKYKKEYCEQLVEWMREGQSFWTFATVPGVTIETLSEWTRVHPEFSEAKKIGRTLEQKWWDNLHRRCAATGEGNITAIVWAQKNKFPKYFKERPAKSDIKHQLNISGQMDYKQLVATMDAEQLSKLVQAIAMQTTLLEEQNASSTNETKRLNPIREES